MPTGRSHLLRRPPFFHSLDSDAGPIRKTHVNGRTFYALHDALALLLPADRPVDTAWQNLIHRDSSLAHLIEEVPFPPPNHSDKEQILPAASLESLLIIVQSLNTPRAQTVKRYLAATAVEQLEEAANPELAVARVRREYEARGLPRQWIDQRLRSISARAEVVSEWHRRGAASSDDYRTLTNTLMQEAFGMDVETYRQHKALFGRENLRDHMTDLELALVSLAETVAANLHRSKGSKSLPELETDMTTAGAIAAQTRHQIESATAQPVITGEQKPWSTRHRNPKESPASPDAPGRQVLYKRAPK